MKKKICLISVVVLLIVALLPQFSLKSIAVSSTIASLKVDTKNTAVGNGITVGINLSNSVDFVAGNFEVTYDSTKLQYTGYTVGNSLKKTDGTTNGTIYLNTSTSGQIKIGYMSDVDESTETKNAGVLLNLEFNVIDGAGTNSTIGLACTTLKKSDGSDITTLITNGTVKIISGIQMDTSNLNLAVGNSQKLSVSAIPSSVDISSETITWTSSNEQIATVDSTGLVTAVAPGTATITATVFGLNAKCTANITSPLESITLSQTQLTLNNGDTAKLEVSYNPSNTTDSKTVTWSSDDETVATVDTTGLVTAVGSGTATITATVGTKSATCVITVNGGIISIELDKQSLTLPKSQIRKLIVTLNSSDTTEDETITWTSSNSTVATVDSNGLVTAKADGTATITATVGDKTATCVITVSGILGDLDEDTNITAYDAYKALKISTDISLGTEVDEETILVGDVNRDQNLTANDSYEILKYSVGLITEF